VPIELQPLAYANMPLPIGCEKTISQPFIVALMTDLLDISAEDVVLEIGTGLGYQAAILESSHARCTAWKSSRSSAHKPKTAPAPPGLTNIETRWAMATMGWSEHAPFDKIMLTAAPDLIPPPLLHQLKSGGKMVLPAGLPDAQQLLLVHKGRERKSGDKGDFGRAVLAAGGNRAGLMPSARRRRTLAG